MLHTARRILAYLLNDAKRAEELPDLTPGAPPAWIVDAAKKQQYAEYAVDVARRSHELAESAVKSLQDKASSHLTFLLALVPFALAGTALTVPSGPHAGAANLAAFVLLAIADSCLVAAMMMTTLAAGMIYGGGISLDRLGDLAKTIAPKAPPEYAIRAAEAEARRFATLLLYASNVRVANDLFAGRRLTLIAVLLATIGLLILVVGGGVDLFRAPTSAT